MNFNTEHVASFEDSPLCPLNIWSVARWRTTVYYEFGTGI